MKTAKEREKSNVRFADDVVLSLDVVYPAADPQEALVGRQVVAGPWMRTRSQRRAKDRRRTTLALVPCNGGV